MDYEKDITIDPNALDIEWLRQPELAFQYGKYWTECKENLAKAEENIKLIRSELSQEAFSNPSVMGKDVKATAPSVEAYYRNHLDHIEAKKRLIEAQSECDIAEIAYKEISISRKAALQNLVELHGHHYFAGPVVPRNLSEEIQHKQTEFNKKIKLTSPSKKFKRKPKN